jgi:hypothetical protein
LELDRQIKFMIDMTTTKDPALREAYQGRLAELLRERALIAERVENVADPAARFDDMFELAVRLLANLATSGKKATIPPRMQCSDCCSRSAPATTDKVDFELPKLPFPFN